MNIKERDRFLKIMCQCWSLSGHNPFQNINPLEYFESLRKPPLLNYIPYQTIEYLYTIMKDPYLFNKLKQKFQLQNDALAYYGFKPLASGTNRRAFYCEYDPTIILKIAIDDVGMSDNAAEFKLQHILKPFCPKIYELGLNGVVALTERVETMTEDEFVKYWGKCAFLVIYMLYFKKYGYMMEDVGAKFFKNFGYRLGLGLVILDFPYIYKVDPKKLICTHKDPETGEICGGTIDYDFDMGLSQIVCLKCGSRYLAKQLAQETPEEEKPHNKFDVEVPVIVVKGGEVVFDPYHTQNK